MLPVPYQLDPSFGSYYSNASGLFRGDVRYYNLSSIPYDTNVTLKPIADRIMENANISAIPELLGNWNWSAADTIRIKVHDMMTTVANVSESIAIFQVHLPLPYVWLVLRVTFRGSSSYLTLLSRIPYSWSSMVCTSRKMVPSMRLLKKKGMSLDPAIGDNLFDTTPGPRQSTYGTSRVLSLSARRTILRWFYKTR